MKNTTQTVSKGRIVFFQTKLLLEEGEEAMPAIVTKVHDNDTVDLTAFPPGLPVRPFSRISYYDGYDQAAEPWAAWWWPPRA